MGKNHYQSRERLRNLIQRVPNEVVEERAVTLTFFDGDTYDHFIGLLEPNGIVAYDYEILFFRYPEEGTTPEELSPEEIADLEDGDYLQGGYTSGI